MSLILNGTTGISDVDGTAAAPALTGTDTNTGIFFPAADTIAFAEGGVESVRIDASGNLGIGTTSPTEKLTVSGAVIATSIATSTARDATIVDYQSGVGSRFIAGRAGGNYGQWEAHVAGASGITKRYQIDYQSIHSWYAADGTTERARIDSSGNLLVGVTATAGGGGSIISRSGNGAQVFQTQHTGASDPYGVYINYLNASPNGTGNHFIQCNDSAALRMTVRSNGGIANYSANDANLSDRREKTNFAPAKSYLDVICAIPVQTFNYIDQNLEEDDGLTLGVVAQDVQAVAPEMVMESNWGTEEDPKMRLSIYQTDLQYALMKCIQEQQALITALTTRITALEGVA